MSSYGMASLYAMSTHTTTAFTMAPATTTMTGITNTVATAATSTAATAASTIFLGGAAAFAAGILIAQGLMWCGEKMEANYQAACQEWAAFENKAVAESRANVEEVSSYLTTELEYLSLSEFADAEPPAGGGATVDLQELEQVLARARRAQKSTETDGQTQAATERKLRIARLRAEIKTGRDILPAALLAEAETALTGSTEAINTMLARIEDAWQTIKEASALQTRHIQQTQQLLTQISAKLSAIDSMIRDSDPGYQKQLRQIYEQVSTIRDELRVQPEQAFKLAERAQQDAEALLAKISASAHKTWREQRSIVNVQLGMLAGLAKMIDEAETNQLLQLFNAQKLAELKQRITKVESRGKQLLAGNSKSMRDDIARLTLAVENLKREVFSEVETGQQSTIANLIQETLTELGFQSQAGEPPIIKRNGDITHVEVMASRPRQGQATAPTGSEERSDRVIAFDITRNGQVSYDFGGYVGTECVEDAQQVFAALHKKGIYLINEAALRNLQSLSLGELAQQLQQAQSLIKPEKNKTQAELAETIQGVLNQMGYQHVRVSSVGGSIEMEAFNGNTGYRVIMSPEGEIQIFDGQHTDITNKASDPIAQVSHEVQEESQEVEIKKRKKSYMGSRRGHMISH